MADPFAAMLGIGIDDEQKMQALADRLRGRQGAAEMFSLSTVPQISAGAVNEQNQVGNSLEQVGGLRKALAQRKATAEQKRLDREATAERDRLKQAFDAEQGDLDRQAEVAKPGPGSGVRLQGDRTVQDEEGNIHVIARTADGQWYDTANHEPVTEDQMMTWTDYSGLSEAGEMRGLTKLGERASKANELMSDIENLDGKLAGYAEEGADFEDIPGFGYFEKQANPIGGITRFTQDLMTPGAEYGDNYAAAKSVINTISRLRAGLAQTVTEVERIKDETGTDVLSSPEVFMQYYPRLKEKIEEDFALIRSTTPKRIVETYEKNLPEGGRNPFTHKFRRFEFGGEEEETPRQKRIRELQEKQNAPE